MCSCPTLSGRAAAGRRVVATRMQSNRNTKLVPEDAEAGSGPLAVARDIARCDGLLGFWKGVLPALVMVCNPTGQVPPPPPLWHPQVFIVVLQPYSHHSYRTFQGSRRQLPLVSLQARHHSCLQQQQICSTWPAASAQPLLSHGLQQEECLLVGIHIMPIV